MHVVCTYCSASKDPDPGHVPAFRRYISNRIDHVHEISEQLGARFCVLSGLFGLVDWEEPLPLYDHALQHNELERLTKTVVHQLKGNKVTEVDYFTLPLDDQQVELYRDVIQQACKEAAVEYREHSISREVLKGSGWRRVMEEAADARELLKSDREAGTAAFDELVARYPDDGMVFFQRASGYQALREYELARADYESARQIFPLERWKREAERAIEAMARGQSLGGTLAEIRRRLDALKAIDRGIRDGVAAAGEAMERDLPGAAVDLRRCSEILVRLLLQDSGVSPFGGLLDSIRQLRHEVGAPNVVEVHLNTVRLIGNVAAHPSADEPPLRRGDGYACLNALVTVLEWWDAQREHEKG